MLRIRADQEEVFRAEKRQQFLKRLADDVRESCAPSTDHVSDDDLSDRVAMLVDRAKARGVTWESSVFVFTCLGIVLGPRFDTHPEVEQLLTVSGSINERVKELPGLLPREVWLCAGQEPCGAWPEPKQE